MKKTHEQFISEMQTIHPNIDVLDRYISSHERIRVRCRICGTEWSPKAYHLIQGHGCPECGKQLAVINRKGKTAKKTTEQFINELSLINNKITITGEYTGNNNKIDCCCNVCGHNWSAVPYSLLNGSGCPECSKVERSKYRRYTTESFKDKVSKVNSDIEIISHFTKSTEIIEVKCLKCGNIWYPKAYKLLQGRGCPMCAHKEGAKNNKGKTGLKTQEQFLKELADIDSTIEVLGKYINGHTNVKLRCTRCNHTWEAKPYSLLQGHGCPRCVKSGTSFMEQLIYLSLCEVFGKENVLSRDRTLIGMELDIVIPKYNIAIEPGNWLLHRRSINRDAEKRKRCMEKGYRLITVYDKYPEDIVAPFESDCYVYSEDLNKADHYIIHELIRTLILQIGTDFSELSLNWEYLENMAYENSKTKTHEDFVAELEGVNPTIQVQGKYVNTNKRIHVKCLTCGFEWDAVPANLLEGDGCRKCGTKVAHKPFIKEQSAFEEEVKKANPNVEIIGVYTGRHSPVKARCRICGYEWEPMASSLLRGSNHKGAKGIHAQMKL